LTYRSRYANTAQFAPALHLLLIDETNPRGIAYQAAALVQHVDQLPRHAQSGGPMAERALAQQAVKLLRSADLVHLGKTGPEGRRNGLASLLGELAISAKGISDALTRHFFGQSGMESVFNGR
ncbi:MAG: alpha-E domain-containing protein, partial [Alphaproteobacteria bacterium]|nr:alpha-E domain-containing protein [Alphaproteobacteria bacterium]